MSDINVPAPESKRDVQVKNRINIKVYFQIITNAQESGRNILLFTTSLNIDAQTNLFEQQIQTETTKERYFKHQRAGKQGES
jgi:hypothetical protein